MFTLQLHIPEQKAISDNYQGVLPDAVALQNWLSERDQTDKQGFLDTLASLNRIYCEPFVRMELMNLMESEIENELLDLLKQTELTTFPINNKSQDLSDTLQRLLLESSVAYQIIARDISDDKIYTIKYIDTLLPESLFMAFSYLSRLLVERFHLYLSEPAFIWQELNQLYLLAERISAHKDKIKTNTSIQDKYLQIAILKVLDPYRLMRFEARKIYLLMEKWVQYCDIVAYSQQDPESNIVIDLMSGSSPHYFNLQHDSKENNTGMLVGRILKMEGLREYIDNYIEAVEQQKSGQDFSYQDRMYNEMLRRIDNDISVQNERSEERLFVGNEIKLVSGFRACHHFISDRKPFDPQAEIDAQLKRNLEENLYRDDSGINLINLLEEEKLLKKKNPMGELQSINPFMPESEVVGDVWEHIHADSVIHATIEASQKQLKDNLKEESWKQKNSSDHGMLLVSNTDIEMPIAVGMLVAYRLNVDKAYCLAVVKWLRINPRKGMAIGVKLISVDSRAIALKGEEGIGAGGNFHRAFLVTKHDLKGKAGELHLIVPTGLYDRNSILKVWHKKKLKSIKMKQILFATDSFEQVTFKNVGKNK